MRVTSLGRAIATPKPTLPSTRGTLRSPAKVHLMSSVTKAACLMQRQLFVRAA